MGSVSQKNIFVMKKVHCYEAIDNRWPGTETVRE